MSWNIAYGKNGFPRSLTSSLYCLKTALALDEAVASHVALLLRLRAA